MGRLAKRGPKPFLSGPNEVCAAARGFHPAAREENSIMTETTAWSADGAFANADEAGISVPIHLVTSGTALETLAISEAQRQWLATQSFKGSAKKAILLPAADGSLQAVVFGLGSGKAGEPSGPSELLDRIAGLEPSRGHVSPRGRHSRSCSSRRSPGASAPTSSPATAPPATPGARPRASSFQKAPTPRASSTRSKPSGSAAISSTRRPATSGPISSRKRRASSPPGTARISQPSAATIS